MTDEPLRRVTIADGLVTRPAGTAAATVQHFLRFLRSQGIDSVAEPVSLIDDVETLRYLPGASGADGWQHQHTDEGLASAARLLRQLHDASQAWTPPYDAIWAAPEVAGDDIVYCHGDPGPWNFVWEDNTAIGLIDWDYLHPAPRLDDIAYALYWFAPLRRDEHALHWHHFPEVPDRRHRVSVFLEAYGDLPAFDVVDAVAPGWRRCGSSSASWLHRGKNRSGPGSARELLSGTGRTSSGCATTAT